MLLGHHWGPDFSLSFSQSRIHSLSQSLTHPLTHFLTQSSIYSFIQSLPYLFTEPFANSSTHSLIPSFIQSSIHLASHLFTHSFSHLAIHLFIHLVTQTFTQQTFTEGLAQPELCAGGWGDSSRWGRHSFYPHRAPSLARSHCQHFHQWWSVTCGVGGVKGGGGCSGSVTKLRHSEKISHFRDSFWRHQSYDFILKIFLQQCFRTNYHGDEKNYF